MSGRFVAALTLAALMSACSPAADDQSKPATNGSPSAATSLTSPTEAPPLSPTALCRSAVVGFRNGWFGSNAGAATLRQAAEAWRRPGERLLTQSGGRGMGMAALGRNLHRPRVALLLKQSGADWFVSRTYGCTKTPGPSLPRCLSQVHFRGQTYAPERPRVQVGVGRIFGQASVEGCFGGRGGTTLLLRGPATPVTVWQEEEVPSSEAVVVSLVHPGPTIYDS